MLAIVELRCVVTGFRLNETREGSGKTRKEQRLKAKGKPDSRSRGSEKMGEDRE